MLYILVPTSVESATPQISITSLCFCMIIFLLKINYINQSEDEIFLIFHGLPHKFVPCVLSCWLIKLYTQDMHKNGFNHFIFFQSILKIKSILRTYSASLELWRNIYFNTDFTYEMRAMLYCSTVHLTILRKKKNKLELQVPFSNHGNYWVI